MNCKFCNQLFNEDEDTNLRNYLNHLQLNQCKKNIMNKFINDINNINICNYGSNTQLTSKEHEHKVYEIIKKQFFCKEINNKEFRKFIKKNNYEWCNFKESTLIRSCPPYIKIINNNLNLIKGQNYIINQPSGGQNFPDICLISLDEYDNLQLSYIECKQKIPKFNNNPPKMNKNCIYICGNEIYNGFLLTTKDWQNRKNNFISKYNLLAKEHSSDDMIIVPYKVIELKWIEDKGSQCFIERKEQNLPLINECFSRFLVN